MPEALAFLVPIFSMIAIVLLSAFANNLANTGEGAYAPLGAAQRAAVKSL